MTFEVAVIICLKGKLVFNYFQLFKAYSFAPPDQRYRETSVVVLKTLIFYLHHLNMTT